MASSCNSIRCVRFVDDTCPATLIYPRVTAMKATTRMNAAKSMRSLPPSSILSASYERMVWRGTALPPWRLDALDWNLCPRTDADGLRLGLGGSLPCWKVAANLVHVYDDLRTFPAGSGGLSATSTLGITRRTGAACSTTSSQDLNGELTLAASPGGLSPRLSCSLSKL